MANEAVIVELLGEPKGCPIKVSVPNATGVEKGTIMVMSDGRSGAATAAANSGEIFAGIAAAEKVASDGQVWLSCYTKGIFDLTCESDGVTMGAKVTSSGANKIRDATEAEIAAGSCIGKALETGAADEVIQVAVGVYN